MLRCYSEGREICCSTIYGLKLLYTLLLYNIGGKVLRLKYKQYEEKIDVG